jgi:hypothetical protein
MSKRLARLNVPHRAQADALLAWAAWNLDTGQMGWDMLQLARPGGDKNLTGHPLHTVEMGAMNLIFRGVVSAMDQLAAAVFRLTGQPLSADREHSVAWWFYKGHKPWQLVPLALADWLRAFEGNATWALATELRHGFTHRTVQRHVTLTIGVGNPSSGTLHLEIAGARHESEDVMRRLLIYGRQRYSSFERALARSYPMR